MKARLGNALGVWLHVEALKGSETVETVEQVAELAAAQAPEVGVAV